MLLVSKGEDSCSFCKMFSNRDAGAYFLVVGGASSKRVFMGVSAAMVARGRSWGLVAERLKIV